MAKPKVFSLLKTNKMDSLFLNVPILGHPENVFVQCVSYDLKLPLNGRERGALDIFEETVLRMIRTKKCPIDELADILCMEKDLANFIVIRLKEKGLLVDNYTLSDMGESQLEAQAELRSKVEYHPAKLFMVNDVILPYIYVGSFVTEDVLEFDDESLTLGFGSIGDRKEVRGRRIRLQRDNGSRPVLQQTRITNAINKYNCLAGKRRKNKILLADDYGIESSKGEDIYFHMQMSVQKGNTEELLVSDGFVSNIDGLAEYIQAKKPNLITYIKSKAVQRHSDEDGLGTPQDSFVGKYHEILKLAKAIERNIHFLSDKSDLDDTKQNIEDKRQSIIDCHSMLEWAFHYYSLKWPISDARLKIFKEQMPRENLVTIKKLAEKIGIKLTDSCANFFLGNFDGRRAEMIYSNPESTIPSMQLAFPMAVIALSEYDNSELKVLISQDRGFMPFINDVSKSAADLRHDAKAKADDVDVSAWFEHAVTIVRTLLPDIDININKDARQEMDHVANERLRATVECEKALGCLLFSSLEDGLQADFRRISMDKEPSRLPAPYEYVQILYRILQTVFYDDYKQHVSKKCMSKGDCIKKDEELLECELPKSITSVRDDRYVASQKGYKGTLGSQFLVLISNIALEKLVLLKEQDIVHVVDDILRYRSHGNNISLILSWEELSELRERVINIVKILGGYEDERQYIK